MRASASMRAIWSSSVTQAPTGWGLPWFAPWKSLPPVPILMTSFAFISGLIPLTIASGAGALGNRSIGTAAAGGMLIGTFVGIFLIPGLYVIFESLATYFKKRKEKEQIKEDEYVY